MNKALLSLLILFCFQSSYAEFLEDAPGEVPKYEANTSSCEATNILNEVDSRLTPGLKATWSVRNVGESGPEKTAIWELSVKQRDQERFVVGWNLLKGTGLDIQPGEPTQFDSFCTQEFCKTNVSRFDDISIYSPCQLTGGIYDAGSEALGFYRFESSGKVVKAHQKITYFEGTLLCPGEDPQPGYRKDEMILSDDVPNYVAMTACSPTIILRSFTFMDANGKIKHEIHNMMTNADLKIAK